MKNPRVFFNLFINGGYLLLVSIGMTFVILTGGIDLSVGGVIAPDYSGIGCIAQEWRESCYRDALDNPHGYCI